MSKSGFKWIVSPDVIANGIDEHGQKMLVMVQAVANYWGRHIQDVAKKERAWEDRTGHARSGLFFGVDGFGLNPVIGDVTPDAKAKMTDVTVESGSADTLIITLGHTVFYGKFLELSNGGKNAVIMSTLEGNLPMLERMLRDALRG